MNLKLVGYGVVSLSCASWLFTAAAATSVQPAGEHDLRSAWGGSDCEGCKRADVSCESSECVADPLGSWFVQGSGQTEKVYCESVSTGGYHFCIDDYTQGTENVCKTYFECSDFDCQVDCQAIQSSGVSGGCVGSDPCA